MSSNYYRQGSFVDLRSCNCHSFTGCLFPSPSFACPGQFYPSGCSNFDNHCTINTIYFLTGLLCGCNFCNRCWNTGKIPWTTKKKLNKKSSAFLQKIFAENCFIDFYCSQSRFLIFSHHWRFVQESVLQRYFLARFDFQLWIFLFECQ